MPAWALSLVNTVIGLIAKGLALLGVYLAGEKAQQAKDQQKVIDATKTRADVENANAGLSNDDVLAKLLGDR